MCIRDSSNDECAAKLLELSQEGCKKFALCHLSQENNTPMLALQTVFSTLGTAGVVPDKDCICLLYTSSGKCKIFLKIRDKI